VIKVYCRRYRGKKYISFRYEYLVVQTSIKSDLNSKCILFLKDDAICYDPVSNKCIVFILIAKVQAGCSDVTDPFALFGFALYMQLQYTKLLVLLDYKLISDFISNLDILIVLQ